MAYLKGSAARGQFLSLQVLRMLRHMRSEDKAKAFQELRRKLPQVTHKYAQMRRELVRRLPDHG